MASDEKAGSNTPGIAKIGVKGFNSVKGFIDKFNYDWVLSLASGLAFNLMVATIPIIIAILALAGFIFGGLNPSIQQQLIQQIQQIFPPPIPSQEISWAGPQHTEQGCRRSWSHCRCDGNHWRYRVSLLLWKGNSISSTKFALAPLYGSILWPLVCFWSS